MRNPQVLGVVLFAMLAFGAIIVAPASAEFTLLAEWLVNGTGITALISVETRGELLLKDTSNGATIICSVILDGSVGPNGEGEVTEVLSTAGVVVTLAAPLLCRGGPVCEINSTDVEVSPEGLPFHSLLFLMEIGSFLDVIFKATYTASCLVLGIKITDECTVTNGITEVVNASFGVESIGNVIPLGTCSIGGAGTGELELVTGNQTQPLTGTLSVSE
jgi:hypothetical protein